MLHNQSYLHAPQSSGRRKCCALRAGRAAAAPSATPTTAWLVLLLVTKAHVEGRAGTLCWSSTTVACLLIRWANQLLCLASLSSSPAQPTNQVSCPAFPAPHLWSAARAGSSQLLRAHDLKGKGSELAAFPAGQQAGGICPGAQWEGKGGMLQSLRLDMCTILMGGSFPDLLHCPPGRKAGSIRRRRQWRSAAAVRRRHCQAVLCVRPCSGLFELLVCTDEPKGD